MRRPELRSERHMKHHGKASPPHHDCYLVPILGYVSTEIASAASLWRPWPVHKGQVAQGASGNPGFFLVSKWAHFCSKKPSRAGFGASRGTLAETRI